MKDSGIPWIGEIPEGWKIYRIKYLCIFNPTENSACNFTSVGYAPMNSIRWKNISASTIERSKLSSGLTYFEDGDIVMAKVTPCFENGNIAIAENLPNGRAYGSSELFVFRPTNIDTLFMFYALQSEGFKSACCSTMTGTGGLKRISPNYIYGCPMPLPSFSEQKSIADFLDKKCAEIDEMIALQEKIIEELKAYKQSVITEAVTKGLNPDVPMKDSGVEWIGKIPEGWKIARLKYVANKRAEKSNEANLDYIGLEHLTSFSEEMVKTESVYDAEGANICCDGDVIFGKLRPYLGKAKVIDTRCCCSTEFLVLKNNECPRYLRYLILSNWFIEIVNASTYGTKMPRANADFITNMSVPVAPLSEQKDIAKFLDKKCADIDSLISTKNAKIEEMKEYKKSIIYEYVTGKKEVN